MKVAIDADRLSRELEELASFSDTAAPAVTRIVYSEADRQARAYLKKRFHEAGLSVREDAVGNTFARWNGSEPDLAPVATGSHIDAIPFAGKYDGTVGVLGALEAIRALRCAGFQPRRPIELIVFTSEEPTRFGIGCLGSRFLAGLLTTVDGLDEARAAVGFSTSLSDVRLSRGDYHAFIELHIEQGPVLEREQIDSGIVTAIAAPATLRISFEGEGGHAGTVLMRDRRDAFCAAAELTLAVEAAAISTGAADTVATVGLCKIFPGAVNSIPSRAEMSVDVRDIDEGRRDSVLYSITHACREIGVKRRVRVNSEIVNADAPACCDPLVIQALEQACNSAQVRFRTMVSRAYHDTLFMSRIAPSGMLFIPCRGGISHRPDEYADPKDIATGALVLGEALRLLAS